MRRQPSKWITKKATVRSSGIIRSVVKGQLQKLMGALLSAQERGNRDRKGVLGLISMEERLRLANGELTIQRSPGEGTVVTAFIPPGRKPAATKAT